MLIDTHAHLFWDSFKTDLDQVINRALDAGVKIIINVGTEVETSKLALKQAKEISKITVYSSIGIHPHDATKFTTDESIHEVIDELERIYQQNPQKVIAVGECGLDFNFSNPDFIPSSLSIDKIKDLQKKLLKAQVSLAKKLNLPLLIHCRNSSTSASSVPSAWDEIFDFISDWYGILHCYSGGEKETKKALDSNFLISFPATITYPKNEYLREVAKNIPLERIVLETDCPFLPPQNKRGQRNESTIIREIAALISILRDISLEKVAKQTSDNVYKLLNI